MHSHRSGPLHKHEILRQFRLYLIGLSIENVIDFYRRNISLILSKTM